jgi:hypothetical protein
MNDTTRLTAQPLVSKTLYIALISKLPHGESTQLFQRMNASFSRIFSFV